MDTEESRERLRLEQRVRLLEAELESARWSSVTWGEVVVTVLGVVLFVAFFVPALVLFITLFAIGACMRVLEALFGGGEQPGADGFGDRVSG